jgi:hypothetical protein
MRCEGRDHRTNKCSKDASGLITVAVNVMSYSAIVLCWVKLQTEGIYE